MAMAASAAKTSKDPEALKRELWGWYMYDFANSAFFQSAGAVRALPLPQTYVFVFSRFKKYITKTLNPKP
jgi:hypothetical protein